jgi:hypothetical protein
MRIKFNWRDITENLSTPAEDYGYSCSREDNDWIPCHGDDSICDRKYLMKFEAQRICENHFTKFVEEKFKNDN